MFPIHGVVKHYPWGSTDAIPALLGTQPDGKPWAEYWLGAHPDGPATTADGRRLDDVISQHPESLGEGSRATFGERLPFLVKLLAAASPLSIQAHPTRRQAETGHARENDAGMAPDSPQRSFRDDWPKPEVIIALGAFDALVGLRDSRETARLLGSLNVAEIAPVVSILAKAETSPESTRQAFLAVLEQATTGMVTALAAALDTYEPADEAQRHFRETARLVTASYSNDPTVLVALMLNRRRFQKWEAVMLPAGTMHAYLQGVGVEVMGASDNVVRGGLTSKHVDVPVLTEIGDFRPRFPPVLTAREVTPGLLSYETGVPEFRVWLIRSPEDTLQLPADDRARMVTGLSGELTLHGAGASIITRGDAVFVEAGEPLAVSGHGEAVLVSSGHDLEPSARLAG